jgi:hypothetical protein
MRKKPAIKTLDIEALRHILFEDAEDDFDKPRQSDVDQEEWRRRALANKAEEQRLKLPPFQQ